MICPRCGRRPESEFKMLAPVVACASADAEPVAVLRHAVKDCGRWVFVSKAAVVA